MIIELRTRQIVKCFSLSKENEKDLKYIAEALGEDEDNILDGIIKGGISQMKFNIDYACNYEASYEEEDIPDIPDYSVPPWERA